MSIPVDSDQSQVGPDLAKINPGKYRDKASQSQQDFCRSGLLSEQSWTITDDLGQFWFLLGGLVVSYGRTLAVTLVVVSRHWSALVGRCVR